MKTYFKIIVAVTISVLLFNACNKDDEHLSNSSQLRISPIVDEISAIQTKALGDHFFAPGFGIDVTVWPSNNTPAQSFVYYYGSNGIFSGNPGYYFTMDDNYIDSLTAIWPTDDIRQQPFATDQREFENYRQADWMTASSSEIGIMPTDKPVPLNFVRENTMLDFELVGQNAEGINISSLLIELHDSGNAIAYWAYCGDNNGHAELILQQGTQLTSPDQYLIGRVSVENSTNEYTIIFPQTDLTLEAGKRYLVTLTPRGYFMTAYVTIGGWNQGDDGIGIPFQQPTPDINGNFVINNPLQLITMSYLVRHYTDGTTFNWPSRTYVLSNTFEMTSTYASQYIRIPKSKFTGKVVVEGSTTPVDTIYYGTGQSLPLFDINN